MELCAEHCIITYIDLIGIGKKIINDSSKAVSVMQKLHKEVNATMQSDTGMPHHSNAYVWNDSVLLVAYTDNLCSGVVEIIREISALKRRIDAINKSFVVIVKGMNFKEPSCFPGTMEVAPLGVSQRFVYIKASSYAFANCFEIEKALGKKYKRDWYIDQRVVNRLNLNIKMNYRTHTMLPNFEKRRIYMFDGYPYR